MKQAVLPIFIRTNLLIQQEDSNLYLVAYAMHVLSKFVSLQAFKDKNEECIDVTEIDFNNSANHLASSQTTIGIVTEQILNF